MRVRSTHLLWSRGSVELDGALTWGSASVEVSVGVRWALVSHFIRGITPALDISAA
jgi:hypothetical protein